MYIQIKTDKKMKIKTLSLLALCLSQSHANCDDEIKRLTEEITVLNEVSRFKDTEIDSFDKLLAEKEKELKICNEAIKGLTENITVLETANLFKDEKIKDFDQSLAQKEKELDIYKTSNKYFQELNKRLMNEAYGKLKA